MDESGATVPLYMSGQSGNQLPGATLQGPDPAVK
jgi:hypothetical protein